MFTLLLVFVSVAAYLLYLFSTKYHTYWLERRVPHEKPHFLSGNFADAILQRKSFFDFDIDVYRKFPNEKVFGYYEFRRPVLWIRDLEIVRLVFVKDFDHFVDRREFNLHNKYFDEMVSNMRGEEWKNVRNVLTPTFTSGKLKRTFGCVTNAGDEMCRFLEDKTEQPVEMMRDVFGRYTMQVIASTAFAVDSHSFTDPNATFSEMAGRIFSPGGWKMFFFFLAFIYPDISKWLPFSFADEEAANFFVNITKATIEHRRKNGVEGNDFLQLMLDTQTAEFDNERDNAKGKQVLTDDQVIAQSVMFFAAGYETTAATLSFAAYELARNLDVQKKLLEEIATVLEKHDGRLTYEATQEMEYMDMVLSETLRLYPVVTRLDRECTEEYQIPETNLIVEKGMVLAISVCGIHRDPQYYPEPERFDPERFSPEAKQKRHPYAYLPFGHGPRNCIGMRFALMESKVCLAKLLLHYKLNICSKTDIPLTFSKETSFLHAANGVWLELQKRAPTA